MGYSIQAGEGIGQLFGTLRRLAFIIALLLCSGLLAAQIPAPSLPPDGAPPIESTFGADAAPPIITFSQVWRDAFPPFYAFAVESTGRASYQSSPKDPGSGDPYFLRFVLSREARTRIYDLVKQLNYFRGDFDYKKGKIAYTGTKTLVYINGDEKHRTVYNWSDNVALQQLTTLFQNMSETIEIGRMISEKYRFDKLGVDAEMKKLEQASKDNRVAELQAIQPILSRIAKDSSMMNITRRRAESLLAKIPQSAQVNGQK